MIFHQTRDQKGFQTTNATVQATIERMMRNAKGSSTRSLAYSEIVIAAALIVTSNIQTILSGSIVCGMSFIRDVYEGYECCRFHN